jgi:hypothetical protein
MANIEKRIDTDGSLAYQVKIRLKGHPTESATFNRKTDAKKRLRMLKSVIRDNICLQTNMDKNWNLARDTFSL